LTVETLETLLTGEDSATEDATPPQTTSWEDTFVRPQHVPVTVTAAHYDETSPISGSTAISSGIQPRQHNSYNKLHSFSVPNSSIESTEKDEDSNETSQRIPLHDQRTIVITNLSDRTTHKDLTSIIRGGRLLDVFLRNDRSATVSFVEGAADFLAYVKRNDIYLHQKRVSLVPVCFNPELKKTARVPLA
jgi:hypothetical protein